MKNFSIVMKMHARIFTVMNLLLMASNGWAVESSADQQVTCEISSQAFFRYEAKVLRVADQATTAADFVAKAGGELRCIFRFYLKSQQLGKAIAGELVSPFIGHVLPKELPKDHRYQKAHAFMVETLEKSQSIFFDSIFIEIAEAHWSVYVPLCQADRSYVCRGFLPKNQEILGQPSLAGAVSISNIVNAAEALSLKDRIQLERQLQELSKKIPKEKKLLRKTVVEAIERLQQVKVPLGLLVG